MSKLFKSESLNKCRISRIEWKSSVLNLLSTRQELTWRNMHPVRIIES